MHGFDFNLNRRLGRVEINDGGWEMERFAESRLRIEGNQLQIAVPLDVFNSGPNRGSATTFDFKWATICQHVDDVMDFHISLAMSPQTGGSVSLYI